VLETFNCCGWRQPTASTVFIIPQTIQIRFFQAFFSLALYSSKIEYLYFNLLLENAYFGIV